MTSSGSCGDDWWHLLSGAEPVGRLWQALQEDGGVYGSACERTFRGLYTRLEATQSALGSLAASATPGTGADLERLLPWLQALARLGPWQDTMARGQALQGAIQRYAAAYAQCAALVVGSIQDGLGRLERRMADGGSTATQEELPESLRMLYDWWLEESEAAYEAMLATPEWPEAIGQLTSAATDAVGSLQEQADIALRALDLPSHADWIETQRRLERLERERHEAGTGPADRDELHALREEVQRLRGEVAELRQRAPEQSPKA